MVEARAREAEGVGSAKATVDWRMGGRVRARVGAAHARCARELSRAGVARGATTLREAARREHLESGEAVVSARERGSPHPPCSLELMSS